MKPIIGGELLASERSLRNVSLASIDSGLCVSPGCAHKDSAIDLVRWPRHVDLVFGQASGRVQYNRSVMDVSARRSRPLQLTWLDQCGRLRGVQGK